MIITPETATTRSCKAPVIRSLPLPAFDDGDLAAVRTAFAAAMPCALGQAWRAVVELGFAPGHVRTGWQNDSLLLFAELTDRDIFSAATGINQRTWELGDTFEVFLRPAGQRAYVEFHVTPNNQRLQLRIPNPAALRRARATNAFDAFLLAGDLFHSKTWVQPENQKWFVYVAIPIQAVCNQSKLKAGTRWNFSFSRYDHTRNDGEPVVSSTSPHKVPDFHRQLEWGKLKFATRI